MSATPTIKQKEGGIPTCNEYALYRMALFVTCGYVPVACVQDEYLNLHKSKFRNSGMRPSRIFDFLRKLEIPNLHSSICNLKSSITQ